MKKNVLQLISSFQQGGSERQAVQLVRMLHEDKTYRIFVACLSSDGVLKQDIERIGFTEIPEFPLSSFYGVNMARQLRRCVRFIRESNIQIIQTHDFYTNIFGMAAGALARVPVRIAAKRETGLRTTAQKFIERRAFNLAHAIVVNSEAVKEYLIESRIAADKISTVYNGVETEKLTFGAIDREQILREFGLPTDESMQFVTIVANLRNPVKNHRMFLRAAEIVRQRVRNVNFILAGEGKLIGEMRAFASELGLESAVFFTGRCTKVAELLSISNVCVLSSESEGFSNSILEYMAAGKPVVATAVGGAREAIIDDINGFLVASNDHEELAAKLTLLIENPEKAVKMGECGRKIAVERFSTTAQIDRTLKLYDSLLRRHII